MDLELSNEQRLLRDSAERFASQRYDTAQRRMSLACEGRWSREIWREIADLGWLAVGVPEADGGLGGGPVEIGLVAEALGRALALEPWLDAILVARLVAALGDASQRERLLAPIMEGARRPALAHIEGARFAAEAVSTQAANSRLTGVKDFVSAPASADDLFVSARTDAGLAVFLVDPSAPGVTIQTFETVDGREAGRVTFDGAEAVRLGSGDATAALAETLDLAAAALSAEAVGCMDSLLAKTIAYTRTREQFGKPLAANQALRHRMADMSVRCEEARGVTLRALLAFGSTERARAAAGAKFKTGRCGRFVAEHAIQLHGAMGVTEELDVGLYAKRLLAIDLSFGAADQHLRRHAALRPQN
jgi:alkylation response protein AidB-like acyl-CoA dehydrogenase